jgi:hypothetical protein
MDSLVCSASRVSADSICGGLTGLALRSANTRLCKTA